MRRSNTILMNRHLPSPFPLGGAGGRLLGLGLLILLFTSCNGKQTLADVAEEDSLCIDTVATLDDVMLTDTVAVDSLAEDTL